MSGATARLKLGVSYEGSGFHGWARQKDASLRTVQQELEEALSLVLRCPVQLVVAGRTDAGVHASGQVAHADVPVDCLEQRSLAGQPQRLVRRLSRLLDTDVRLTSCAFAPPGFDARFSALSRTYEYRVSTDPSGPLPTRRLETGWWPRQLDFSILNDVAQRLTGLHDFAAFCKARPHSTTIRDLQFFHWEDISTPSEPGLYRARLRADAFCWNMVRALVGASLKCADGRLDLDAVPGLLTEHQRSSLVPLAEARGLTLVGVHYPPDEELASRAAVTRKRRNSLID
ncbi:tRNA pseudouridine(38-40) synthase TruA [Corynebacterium poyangense]|uniref:tRNA pseudouridine synthase A n=1 Tax=Corynebacterium poyangense TaxID=2684405 RepID=A0A7H0SM76_9CORY|nr:tRNA pseudouridine synthase A [Corynebacterium poyangense]MBZ8176748.1 tRNA pseudouridine(38-40) synthase TruA [Corynebacterium poyangense]QNQ89651.1 tRNA pseudouridine(38-40) synthase TruA [Corynebacterium poyangense]